MKTCFAISKKVVAKTAPFKALKNPTFAFGSSIYIVVTVNKTKINGNTNLIINSVIIPILITDMMELTDLRTGITVAAANDTVRRAIIEVTMASEIRIENMKFLFCSTLKITFSEFSREANT